MILGTIVVAYHRSNSVGIATEHRANKHKNIHNNSNGSHTIFPHVFQHTPIKK